MMRGIHVAVVGLTALIFQGAICGAAEPDRLNNYFEWGNLTIAKLPARVGPRKARVGPRKEAIDYSTCWSAVHVCDRGFGKRIRRVFDEQR